jgi:spore maturation protein CgeB
MKILCAFGEYNYGKRERGQGYEFSHFLPALKALGHNVVFFETLDRDRYSDFSHLNRSFLETVREERPEIILCVLMHYELWSETLDIARRLCEATLINWATDDSWKYRSFSRLIASHFDLYATTDATAYRKAREAGFDPFVLTQWAAGGAALQSPLPARDCRHAVSFVGSRYGNRVQWIDGLRRKGIDVACFGHGWENGPVAAEEIPRIIRTSVISLNFGDSGMTMEGWRFARSRQIKARIFEVPGCGGFLLTETAADLENYFTPGSEVVTFDDLDDLAGKIVFYLGHPAERDRIALAGHERTRTEHTYEIRFSRLLETATRMRKESGGADRAVEGIDRAYGLDDFSKLAVRHKSDTRLRLFRRLLTIPCVLVWGKERGPRAARRILFELSWRLCGAATYSAAGWPGRIFYRES